MMRDGGWDAFRARPGVRRIVLVAFVAGLGATAWFTLSRSPVQADLEVRLEGEWPPVNSVTLVYSEAREGESMREVRKFPTGKPATISDTPRLTPGTYKLAVTVVTTAGSREFERSIEHSRGGRSRVELRF